MVKATPVDVELEIHRRVWERGRITFAEFMDLALFWPRGGYYINLDHIGPGGDFYTAPVAHPAFGALLCLQVFQMWHLLDRPRIFWLVEMGAGGGLLGHDLIAYSAHLPQEFGDSLHHLCLDRLASPGVEEQLPVELRRKIGRLVTQGIPLRGITGCFLSNELLDSFPVHRVTVQGGTLKEVYVTLDGSRLVEVLDNPSTSALEESLASLDVSLPEGFSAEISLAVKPWVEEVSTALERGFLLTVDYGHPAKELYSHPRRRGTLACSYRHSENDNPYIRIGEQDMTANVDFTSLMESGRSCGLGSLGFNTQGEFLQNLGLRRFMGRLRTQGLEQRVVQGNRLGMQDIIKPEGFGGFRVLAQGKGVGSPSLWGFEPSAELEDMLTGLPVPLLTPLHMPLLEGSYPHLGFQWEELYP